MKKTLLFVIILVGLFLLAGCGKDVTSEQLESIINKTIEDEYFDPYSQLDTSYEEAQHVETGVFGYGSFYMHDAELEEIKIMHGEEGSIVMYNISYSAKGNLNNPSFYITTFEMIFVDTKNKIYFSLSSYLSEEDAYIYEGKIEDFAIYFMNLKSITIVEMLERLQLDQLFIEE